MHNILVFDLETIGLPRKFNSLPSRTETYDTSRVIEIGYVIMDDDGDIVKQVSKFVKYENEHIKISNTHIHGITEDMVEEDGVHIMKILEELEEDMKQVEVIVAHNINFDFNVLLSEIYRLSPKFNDLITQFYKKKQECTMKIGKKYMRAAKYPKLIELYKHIFNENWDQSHRALDDALVCAKCYVEMIS